MDDLDKFKHSNLKGFCNPRCAVYVRSTQSARRVTDAGYFGNFGYPGSPSAFTCLARLFRPTRTPVIPSILSLKGQIRQAVRVR